MTPRKRSTLYRFFNSAGDKFLKISDNSNAAINSLPAAFRGDIVSMNSEPVVLGWTGKPMDSRLAAEVG